jgi:putative cell wall-binding protein/streptogramin lyase
VKKSIQLACAPVAVATCIAASLIGVASATAMPPRPANAVAETSYPLPSSLSGAPGMVSDSQGDVWYSEMTGVAKVGPSGAVTQFPDSGYQWNDSVPVFDNADDAWFTSSAPGTSGSQIDYLNEITSAGQENSIQIPGYFTTTDLQLGPDGNMWLSAAMLNAQGQETTGMIVKVTGAGDVTEFPTASPINDLTFTPDGTLWYAENSGIGWISAGQTSTTPNEVAVSGMANSGGGLLVGLNDEVWFAEQAGIGEITSAHTVSSFPLDAGDADKEPGNLINGPDGNIWFSESRARGPHAAIGRITLSGQITSFPLGTTSTYSDVGALSIGPDGNLWTIDMAGDPTGTANNYLLRITPQGVTTDYPLGTASMTLTTAPNGALWYADSSAGNTTVGQITTTGARMPLATLGKGISTLTFDSSGNAWAKESASSMVELSPVDSTRVSGADRYATAIQIAQTEFPNTAPVVYVASGINYPDALSAGPVAAKAGGPLLLTDPTSLSSGVSAEIRQLSPGRIVVVGGSSAVSESVFNQLNSLAPATRISGADRFATSRAIVESQFTTAGTVYLATGDNFPDALSAGGAAGSKSDPLLLVNGNESTIDGPTATLLRSLGAQQIDLVGGTSAVSPALETSLASIAPVTRLSGADRYGTAEAVNENAYSAAGNVGNVIIATGLNFPDALAASAWAASSKSPLYIAPGACVPSQALSDIVAGQSRQVAVVGGTSALTSAVQQLTPCGS